MENYSNSVRNIFKGVIISIVSTLILLFVYSLVLTYTSIEENTIGPVIIVITSISILIGSSIGNLKLNKNGIMNGAIVGGIYFLLLYCISSLLSFQFNINLRSIILIFSGIIFGIVGGIIGVNKK